MAPKKQAKPAVDPLADLKNQLIQAPISLNAADITALENAGLLDPDTLRAASQQDLQTAINVGKAIRVKRAFPTPTEGSGSPGKTSGIEVVEELEDVTAPEGTTAVKKKMKLDNRLARQLGITSQAQYYTGCSFCRHDLDEKAEEEGIRVEDMEMCPYCNAIFGPDLQVFCYRCSTKMTSDGKCLKCQAKQSDPEKQKIATIRLRMARNLHGDDVVIEAQQLQQHASLMAKIIPTARTQDWIRQVEKGVRPADLKGAETTPKGGEAPTGGRFWPTA